MTTFANRRAVGSTLSSAADTAAPFVLGAARIVVGFLFACHGVASLFGVWGRPTAVAFGAWPGFYAAVIQLVCGVFLALGSWSRVAALIGAGSMAYAYFTVHQEAGLLPISNGGEPAAMFCWTLIAFAAAGPGALRIGSLVTRRSGSPAAPVGTVGSADTADTSSATVTRVAA